jgi:hypothetical protein
VDPHGTLPHRMVDMTMMGQCIHESWTSAWGCNHRTIHL